LHDFSFQKQALIDLAKATIKQQSARVKRKNKKNHLTLSIASFKVS
jgi:hypothetical protein